MARIGYERDVGRAGIGKAKGKREGLKGASRARVEFRRGCGKETKEHGKVSKGGGTQAKWVEGEGHKRDKNGANEGLIGLKECSRWEAT